MMIFVTLHPLHVKSGHDDDDDDDDGHDHADDNHHYASPASPAVVMPHPVHL